MAEEDYGFEEFNEQPVPLVGKKIPDIELEAYQAGKQRRIKLSSYKGKWLVLVFYPADFTFVCPTELTDAAAHYDKFKKEGAEILSISTDTVYVHKAWHDASPAIKKIEFPMVADPAAALSRKLGVYLDGEGIDLRGSFIVDPEGIIRSYEVNDNNIGRNTSELLRKLQAAKFVREHGGAEACPANWHPGEDALKTGMDLVGKI